MKSDIQTCTVGWLISEIIRSIKKEFSDSCVYKYFGYKNVIGLKYRKPTDCLNYLLTQYERKLDFLYPGDEIVVIYSEKVNPKPLLVPKYTDFIIEKVIGSGGFSTVFLG